MVPLVFTKIPFDFLFVKQDWLPDVYDEEATVGIAGVVSLVPCPVILAPIEFKKFDKSTISGSFAQFTILVFPFKYTEAKIMFSVAPTDGKSKFTVPLFILEPSQ